MNWAELARCLWEALLGRGTAVDLVARGAGAAGVQTVTQPLGSGYSVEADRAARRERLRAECDAAMTDPDYQPNTPTPGTTHCNQAVRRIARAMGCEDFPAGMLANDQLALVASGGAWRPVSAETAQRHAYWGGLAVAAKEYHPHGHIAVVYPQEFPVFSPSWAKAVPWVANVGKANGVMGTSKAFPVADGEPTYYIWGEA